MLEDDDSDLPGGTDIWLFIRPVNWANSNKPQMYGPLLRTHSFCRYENLRL